jgi:nicotinamidase-related amidase
MEDEVMATTNRPPRLLSAEDCVLAIIDVQEKLLPVMEDEERVQNNIVRLLQFCRIASIPVLPCEQIKLGSIVEPIRRELEETAPIRKDCFNCFDSPEFRDRLRALDRRALIVAGIEAHICVSQTAIAGLADYDVHVVADATSSRHAPNIDIASNRLLQAGAVVTSTEMFMFEVLRRAGTDAFRQTIKLVK